MAATAANRKDCTEGSVSNFVRERTELCMYVQQLDVQQDQDPTAACESYRKLKWLRSKQRQRLEAVKQQEADRSETLVNGVEDTIQQSQDPSAQIHSKQEDGEDEEAVNVPPEDIKGPFEDLVSDVLRINNVVVACLGPLPVKASDPLGAVSIPCIRDGNSITLCSSPLVGDQIVIFGGRVLRDTSVLLPRAVRVDPLQLERARYTYANSIYSFNIATSTWTYRECSGRVPHERSDHSAVFLAPRHLLIFGGRGRNGQVFRDFFALSLDRWRWMEIDTAASPYERYWHGWCVAFDAEQEWKLEPSIFLFGGKSDALVYNDLHQLQTDKLKRHLADEERSECESDVTSTRRHGERRESDAAQFLLNERQLQRLPTWFVPHTVGKPPSARFGMQVVALENEQLAVIGGWRASKNRSTTKSRLLDLHILDLTTLVWSTPRLSTLVSTQPYVPSERLLFECFYVNHTLVLFGGHTYTLSGETESFTACEDASSVLYKLDVGHMIWRRQKFTCDSEASAVLALPMAHSHSSNNALMPDGRAFTCSSEASSLQLQLTTFDIQAPRRKC